MITNTGVVIFIRYADRMKKEGVLRITVSVDPVDVDLLDRLAALEGSNRSSELRSMLEAMRPTLKSTVEALEAANRTKDTFYKQAGELAFSELSNLMPEVEKLHSAYLGALSRLEGSAAANPRPVNTGVTFDTPLPDSPPNFDLKEVEDE